VDIADYFIEIAWYIAKYFTSMPEASVFVGDRECEPVEYSNIPLKYFPSIFVVPSGELA
jgi:hypothetical protein